MHTSKCLVGGILTAALLVSTSISANELDYELRTGVGHTDNVLRTEANTIDETVGVLGLELVYEHDSSGVELDIVTDAEYRHYADDTIDGDIVGSSALDLVLKLSPRFLTWGVEHRFGNVVADPFAPENPRTRENVNTIATGPNITIPFGGANSLGAIGRAASNAYSETDIDNKSLDGRVFFAHALSRTRNISLNVSATRVDFDNTVLNSSFDRQSAFVAFDSENSRGSIRLSLGVNELHDQGFVRDGKLIDLTFSREVTSSTSIELSASQQLTFAGELFNDLQQPGVDIQNAQSITGVADPLEVTRADAVVRFERSTNSFFASISARNDEFVNEIALDRSRIEARLGGSRRLGSLWRLNYSASLGWSEFDNDPREDDDLSFTVGLRRQLSQSLWLNFDLRHFARNSNEVDASYTENAGFLTLRYSR
jgi:hypothetical protein